jgi:general secretion pathway protein C
MIAETVGRLSALNTASRRTWLVASALVVGLVGTGPLAHQISRDMTLLQPPETKPAIRNSTQNATKTNLNINTLVSAQLFGSSPAGTPVGPAKPQENLPETRLKLELRGVFGSSVEQAGSALIAEKGKTAKQYRVQEKLPGGAVLHAVATDFVTLQRNGRLETLSFPKPTSSSNTRVSSRSTKPGNSPKTASIKERLDRFRSAREDQFD